MKPSVLFVDDDETEPLHRGEQRRTRADGDLHGFPIAGASTCGDAPFSLSPLWITANVVAETALESGPRAAA